MTGSALVQTKERLLAGFLPPYVRLYAEIVYFWPPMGCVAGELPPGFSGRDDGGREWSLPGRLCKARRQLGLRPAAGGKDCGKMEGRSLWLP